MTITADMIKDLRQRAGAGIMECKEALKESDGDIEAALDYLRKKGSSKAAKKADRSTKEGAVAVISSGDSAAMAEVKCETDFVARNEKFQELAKSLADHVAGSAEADDEAFMEQAFAGSSGSVKDMIAEKVLELGENIVVGRRVRYDLAGPGGFGTYVHGVGSIGVLIEVGAESADAAGNEKFSELCRDLAMHIAASAPAAVDVASLPQELIEREKAIFTAQVAESGKPENIIPKIVEGKLKKYYTEACLLEQPFVKDTDMNIGKLLESVGKEIGSAVNVRRFSRFQLGE